MCIMGFLAIAVAYTMRVCLAVAIVEMVVPTNHTGIGTDAIICPVDPPPEGSGNSTEKDTIRYNWNQEQQGWILSSFYIGYVVTHIPGGVLAEKFGGKWVLSLGIFSTAIFTFLTPLAIEYGGYIALIILRILMGIGEGTTFPALSVLLAVWVPARERSKLGSLVLGGGQIGSVTANYVSGLILTHYTWPLVFYFWGVVSIIWFIVFTVLCYSDPDSHPFISQKERDYLQTEIGQLKRNDNLPPTPWKDILTSAPMLAIIVAQIGHDWGFFIMVSDLPKYMKEVLGFNVYDVGLYSSLPYLLMWVVSLSSGVLCDYLIGSNKLSIGAARKIFTAIAAIGPGGFILLASYALCNRLWVVIWFILAMGSMGTYYPGMKVNTLDLSPNYSGSLMALTNGAAALTGIVAPVFVGMMTPNAFLMEWRLVFWITFIIFVVTTVVYVIWASGDIQLWNYPKTWVEGDSDKARNTEDKEKNKNN